MSMLQVRNFQDWPVWILDEAQYVAHTTGKNRTLAVTAAAERVGPESGVIKPLVRHPGPM